jgi:hypothetical protein
MSHAHPTFAEAKEAALAATDKSNTYSFYDFTLKKPVIFDGFCFN